MTAKQFYVGGQALVEGVMMKTPDYVSAAARKPSGKIVRFKRRHISLTQKSLFLRLPFIRGVIFLGEMMVIGIRMLNWSADQQATKKEEKLKPWETTLTLLVSLAFAVALFVLAPYWLTRIFTSIPGTLFNVIDGVFRILIFVGYLWFIALFKDVRRLFQYHGAEHMTVHCHEAGRSLRSWAHFASV